MIHAFLSFDRLTMITALVLALVVCVPLMAVLAFWYVRDRRANATLDAEPAPRPADPPERSAPDDAPDRSGVPIPLLHPDEQLTFPKDHDVMRAVSNPIGALRVRWTIAQATRAITAQGDLLRAISLRRAAALALARDARTGEQTLESAMRLENARALAELTKLTHQRLVEQRGIHAIEREIAKSQATLHAEIAAAQRSFEPAAPPEPPPPTPDPVEEEVRKVGAQFSVLMATLTRGLELQEFVQQQRVRLRETYGDAVAEAVLAQLLDMAGLGDTASFESFFDSTTGGKR